MSVTIAGLKDSKQQRKALRIAKKDIANKLLENKLDINFKNQHGNSLLMSIAMSFFDSQWKVNKSKVLIKQGVDISHQNKYGKTVLDFAKQKADQQLVDLLSK